MRVVFFGPPTPNPAPAYYGPPNALAVLGAMIKAEGHSVVAYDWDRHDVEEMLEDLPRMLREDRPQLIGITVMSVNRGSALALIRALKTLDPGVPVLAGGPYPTSDWEDLLIRSDLDWACIGDGEETLAELIEALETGGSVDEVPGLAMRRDGQIFKTAPRAPFMDLDRLPFPDLDLFGVAGMIDSYAELDRHSQLEQVQMGSRRPYESNAALMVLASRGCIYRCSFCPMSKWQGGIRAHSATYVADMIEHFRDRYGHAHFVMGDNLFSFPRERTVELCEELIRRDAGVEWICMTRSDMVDPELLGLMYRAGCREISYGIETFDWDVQKAMNKNLKDDEIRTAFEMTHAAGITSTLMMMIGNESDSRKALRHTVSRAREFLPDRILINTAKLYPGTTLWDKAMAAGQLTEDILDDEHAATPEHTSELGEPELRYMERMFNHRVSHIPIPPGGPSTEEAKALLLQASFRGERSVVGGECMARPDFLELMKFAEVSRVKRIWLQTHAHALQSSSVRDALMGPGFFDGIIVPLFSMDAAIHDAQTGRAGDLHATRKGMLAWGRNGGKVRVWAWLDRQNVQTLPRWIQWMADHRAREVVLILGRDPGGWQALPGDELPALESVREVLSPALAVAEQNQMSLQICGLPECMNPLDPIHSYDMWQPFDEVPRLTEEPQSMVSLRMEEKGFAPQCQSCARRNVCEGVWLPLLERGQGEFLVPFQEAVRASGSLERAL